MTVGNARQERLRGFTLLELLIVCVVLAILAATVGPRIGSGQTKSHLDSTARSIVALGRVAREHACSDGRAYFLVFDATTRQAWLERQRDPLVAPDPKSIDPETDSRASLGPWARDVIFDDNVKLTGMMVDAIDLFQTPQPTGLRCAFEPTGVADQTFIDLSDGNASDDVRVAVDASSGLTRILSADERTASLSGLEGPPPQPVKAP
jgi:type II secretion system protein H